MALRYVLDENLRGPLWNLVIRHNGMGDRVIDVVRVGDLQAVSLGTKDPELLRWAESEARILVTEDRRSMSKHLAEHLAKGHHSPGVMTLRAEVSLRNVLEFLIIAAHATDGVEWADAIWYVP